MKNKIFKGIMSALVTPLDENGKLRVDAVQKLIDWQLSKGINGFYICGGTGEGPVLGKHIRMEMAEVAVDVCRGRAKIIDHIGSINMDDVVELTEHANRIGVDALSSLPPNFYFHHSEEELIDYYKKISDHTDKPIIVYATGMLGGMDVCGLMEKLIHVPHIIGAKYTMPDYYLMHRLSELNGGDINIINGPDETLLCGLIMGADGGIGTTYNLIPDYYVHIYDAYKAGDIEEAKKWQFKANRIIEILIRRSSYGAIGAVKEALTFMGLDAGHAAAPSKPMLKENVGALMKELQTAGFEWS